MADAAALPALAVVYDSGAASPVEIATAARGLCRPVLVADPAAPAVQGSLPVLRALGTLVEHPAGTDPDVTVRRLKELGVTAVTTFADPCLDLTAALAEALGVRFHTPETALALGDKLRQRSRLAKAGLPAVRYAKVSEPGDIDGALAEVGLPAVLKPRHSAGSRNTLPVATPREFRTVAGELLALGERGLIAEEYLTGDPTVAGERWGDYVSVESVVDGERITHLGVTGKEPLAEPFREGGIFFPATLGAGLSGEILERTAGALRALGIRSGVTHTEFKLTAGGPRLIEVNGRLGGFITDLVGRATGVSPLRIALENALGLPAPVPERIDTTAARVTFQHLFQPPVTATAVASVTGVKETRKLPGVARVELVRRPGDPVDWRQGTQSFTAIVYGDAPDHTALAATLAAVDAGLSITYDGEELP
ncbi:hypothetical protein SRB5_29970 [Streptomyces sp. RB5]|uniref:ATP-grasp domain-containing protein n=1 Tax=Streptomyces smaragdinus TaxID=2585196 RepID=A0A7K0CHC2_9ACTN|nr:hypothetical protein [Streptomyces smaragdinus]MQY12858.1 hypothetical protein [Streptomyces smaragdinus]